jgi:hypothetical protein
MDNNTVSTLTKKGGCLVAQFKFELPEKDWFAYMGVTKNGEIVDEQMFDTLTVRID